MQLRGQRKSLRAMLVKSAVSIVRWSATNDS